LRDPGGKEKVLITHHDPTYGMYSVYAQVNDVGIVKIPSKLSGAEGEGGVRGCQGSVQVTGYERKNERFHCKRLKNLSIVPFLQGATKTNPPDIVPALFV